MFQGYQDCQNSGECTHTLCLLGLCYTLPPFFQLLPASCAPKSEEDKDWLNEQTDKTQIVGVETKGIDVIDVLVDVAREDGDIEEGQ